MVWDPAAPCAAGGAELQAALMARALSRLGHRSILLGADTGQQDGVEWQGIRVRNGGHYETGKLVDTVRAWFKIHRILKEERPDVVVVYGWTALLYVLAWWRKIVPFKLAFVCALDAEIDGEFLGSNPLRGLLFHRGMRLADARLSITEDQAVAFRSQSMSCQVTRLLVADRSPTATASKTLELLWVARCEEVKRPALFLDLAQKLPWARCRMICAPHDRVLWQEMQARAACLPNVEFLEGVPYAEIQNHFDAAKIFVNTSSHEGVPNTFIHAGLGRTGIASLEIDPDKMFDSFAAGVMARGNFEDLTSGVQRLLGEPAVLHAAASESTRFVGEWHDNDRNVASFLLGVS